MQCVVVCWGSSVRDLFRLYAVLIIGDFLFYKQGPKLVQNKSWVNCDKILMIPSLSFSELMIDAKEAGGELNGRG